MRVIVVANVEQEQEIVSKKTHPETELVFVKSFSMEAAVEKYDAVFYLDGEISEPGKFEGKPVFINAVIETLKQKNLPPNFNRMNGWPGFLRRPIWEIVSGDLAGAAKIFNQLGWEVVFIKDEPGLVAARVISMIINEGFFALEEGVSSADEIDLAMKLGTGYPYGPFEWLNKIGLSNIYHLLKSLSVKDKRYLVAPLLEKKYFELISSLKT